MPLHLRALKYPYLSSHSWISALRSHILASTVLIWTVIGCNTCQFVLFLPKPISYLHEQFTPCKSFSLSALLLALLSFKTLSSFQVQRWVAGPCPRYHSSCPVFYAFSAEHNNTHGVTSGFSKQIRRKPKKPLQFMWANIFRRSKLSSKVCSSIFEIKLYLLPNLQIHNETKK